MSLKPGLILGGLALAAVGLALRPRPRRCPRASRVALIGDSIAVGLAEPLAELSTSCAVSLDAASPYVGAHVEGWTGARLNAVLDGAPHVVLVSLGGNDFARPDLETVQAHVMDVVARIRAAGAEPVWIEPPTLPVHDGAAVREIWRRAIGTVAAPARGLIWSLQGRNFERQPDQIHPTEAAYRHLGTELWGWLAARV